MAARERGHDGTADLAQACLSCVRMKRCGDGASPVHRRLHDGQSAVRDPLHRRHLRPRTRVNQHQSGELGGFTVRYGLHRLVWFEPHESVVVAIQREKSLKKYKRDWKINLIERENPRWEDLSGVWRGSSVWPEAFG